MMNSATNKLASLTVPLLVVADDSFLLAPLTVTWQTSMLLL